MTPVMLFAAGFGSRMRHLTINQPKPLIKVGGKALLDHALDLTTDLGPKVVNVHYRADQIRNHVRGSNVLISDETDALLETGGGLRKALPLLGSSPVVTMNTDAVWIGSNPIDQLLKAWHSDMEGLLMLIPLQNAAGHKGSGDFLIDDQGRLARGAGAVYSGLQIIRTDSLSNAELGAFSVNVIWDQMIRRGGLYGVTYDGKWCDVGQPESIAIAERLLEGGNV